MYTEILSNWLSLRRKGKSIATICEKNNWRKLAVYGMGTFFNHLYEEMDGSVHVSIIYIIDKDRNSKSIPGNVSFMHPDDITRLEDIDAVIVTPVYDFLEIQPFLLQKTDAEVVSIYTLLMLMSPPQYMLEIEELLLGSGSHLINVHCPEVRDVKNPSFHEQFISSPKSTDHFVGILKDKAFNCLMPFYQDWSEASPENIEAVCNLIQEKDVETSEHIAFFDMESKYVNIVNGRRLQSNSPKEYRATIYLTGICWAFGRMVPDHQTPGFILQELLNSHEATKGLYKVVSLVEFNKGKNAFFKLIKKLELKENDMIFNLSREISLYQMDYSNFKSIHGMSLLDVFNRPHTNGNEEEIFMDAAHINAKGYKYIGEALFNQISKFTKKIEFNHIALKDDSVRSNKRLHENNETLSADSYQELDKYIDFLKQEKVNVTGTIGCIVMNCNPFTNGHLFLITEARKKVDFLYIFVVEEDKSYFPFQDRFELVKKGTSQLTDIKVIPSGQFIISTKTFEDYFRKDSFQNITIDASKDLNIFAKFIAPALDIHIRFVGDEPICKITEQYNHEMERTLPFYNIKLNILDRLAYKNTPISASYVRELIGAKELDKIREIVPDTTYCYIKEKYFSF